VTSQAVKSISIEEATRFCEAAVPQYCIKTSCLQYCSTFRTKNSHNRCAGESAADKRCKLKPAGGTDDPKNKALDAQNRDQLWACIAEKRDPKATTTGRRTTPWHIKSSLLLSRKLFDLNKEPNNTIHSV